MEKLIDASKVIDRIGGTSLVAKLCDVTRGAVSQWRKKGIPKHWVKYLKEVHPEAFIDA